jgi:hypothetical protein
MDATTGAFSSDAGKEFLVENDAEFQPTRSVIKNGI